MGAFSLWRTLGYQLAGVDDQYLSQVVITPGVLLFRLLQGYKITVGWGWTYPLEQSLPWVSGAKGAALLLLGVIAVIGSLGWMTARLSRKGYGTEVGARVESRSQRTIQRYSLAAFLGLILVGAGYVPVLTVFLPSLSDIGSRFNLFATIGGAVFVASVLMIGSLLLVRNQQHSRYLFLALAVPFVVLGIATQASVQYHNRIAWREQRAIWNELFTIAPNLKDNTMVLFILPDFLDRTGYFNWQRTPLSASWEASSAIRLLYSNARLSAEVCFPDIETPVEPKFTDEGILTQDTGTLTPYAQIVAIRYDSAAGTLEHLDQLPVGLIPGGIEPTRLCSDCVLSEGLLNVPLRELVQE
jgi:hypothetical protein